MLVRRARGDTGLARHSPTCGVGEGESWRFRIVCGADTLLVSDDCKAASAATRDVDLLRHGAVQLRACMSADGLFYFACLAETGERLAASPMFPIPSDRDAAQTLVGRMLTCMLPLHRP
jgi:hypothetical protein